MASREPRRILVAANETVGGRALINKVRGRAEEIVAEMQPYSVWVICPQNQPKHGYVLYEDSIRTAAENRLKTTLAELKQAGVSAEGDVVDPDPYSAIVDAVDQFHPHEIIISTHPETRSGWLRRDFVSRVASDTGLPVEHVVVDLEADREEVKHTLVVANETVQGAPLLRRLKEKAAEEPHRFTVICPQSGHDDHEAYERLATMLKDLEDEGLEVVGQVMHPDPYTSIQNALQFYTVDEIVISTYPDERSGWLRGDLVGRVERSTSKPVEHIVGATEQAHDEATT